MVVRRSCTICFVYHNVLDNHLLQSYLILIMVGKYHNTTNGTVKQKYNSLTFIHYKKIGHKNNHSFFFFFWTLECIIVLNYTKTFVPRFLVLKVWWVLPRQDFVTIALCNLASILIKYISFESHYFDEIWFDEKEVGSSNSSFFHGKTFLKLFPYLSPAR